MADLHVHSNFSDGSLSIEALVDLYGRRGFGAIAITDHLCERHTFLGVAARYLEKTLTADTFSDYQNIIARESERAWRQYGMVVIPGVELTKNSFFNHRSAHVLGLGVRHLISPEGEPRDLAREIRLHGGCAVAAHPVPTRKFEAQTYYLWNRREELREDFDAWEIASGQVLFPEVKEARLPVVANSDLHHPSQMESWKTVFDCDRTEEAILNAIRKQELDIWYFNRNCAAGF